MLKEMTALFARHVAGHDRLSGQDAAFLSFEGTGRPMHLGALAFVPAEKWLRDDGELDVARLRETLVRRARAVPTLGKRLSRAPLTGWPVWIGADLARLADHVEVSAPVATRGAAGRVAEIAMATPLNRTRPLWRLIIVPGIDDGRTFGLVFLAHHGLIDGIAGIDLLAQLLDGDGPARQRETPGPGVATSRWQLLGAEALRWLELPTVVMLRGLGMATDGRRLRRALRRGQALARTCVRLLTPGPRTVLRSDNDGRRHVAWFSIDERPVRYARRRLGGTPNDIVLAAVAEAIGDMGGGEGHLPFRKMRAAIPVSLRARSERYEAGNRIGLVLTPLEVRERNAGRRVSRIHRHTSVQKVRGDAEGYEVLCELTAWTGQWSQRLLHWLAGTLHSYGVLVTNVPGPSRAYTLGGAELEEIYPLVPLFGGQAVSVGVIRYGTTLRVGVLSSWPDRAMVEAFAGRLETAFARLTRATVYEETAVWAPEPAAGTATADS